MEFRVVNTTKKKRTETKFSLKYDNMQFYHVEYDGENLIQIIERTHPKKEKSSDLVYVVNKDIIEKNKEIAAKKARKEEQKKLNVEQRKKKEELRIQKEEQKLPKWIQQFEEQIKARETKEEQQKRLQKLPQIGIKDVLVRRTVFICMHYKHKVKDLTAAVKVIGDDEESRLVQISAGYCEQCKVYFIMESTYERLRNMGVVLCRICDEKSYMNSLGTNGMMLAQESILMQFGYNVSQKEGLSASRRQKILAIMIDNKVISKSEIISYLDFFISQRQYQSKFELAVSKWEADREFVQEYKIGQYTQFGVNVIYRR